LLRYFTSRELSLKFNLNLAKWKRWSRAFLPPDPLGGLQSGYARQYSIDQAFCVYLGGVLVSELKFTLPEAGQILDDLKSWLGAAGIYLNAKSDQNLIDRQLKPIRECLILVGVIKKAEEDRQRFCYAMSGELSAQPAELEPETRAPLQIVKYPISVLPALARDNPWTHLRVLNMTNILAEFVSALGIDRGFYPAELFPK